MSDARVPSSRRLKRGSDQGFRLRVAVLIAVVSVAGVLSAWQASRWAGESSGLTQQGLQHLVHRQQELNKLTGIVDQDVRLRALYVEHTRSWSLLRGEAERIRAVDPLLADSLDLQAREEHALARSLRPFFLTYEPSGTSDYDAEEGWQDLRYFSEELKEFQPPEIFAQAADSHDRALEFERLIALFAVALFLLTLAQLARSEVRHYFALSGGVVTAVGMGMFVVALAGWSA